MFLNLNHGKLQVKVPSMMKFVYLKQTFKIYQIGSFQEEHEVAQRYPQSEAYIDLQI